MLDASYALHLTRRNAAIDADVLFNVDLDGVDPENEQDILKSSTSFELKMSEPQYKEDFSPISSNCNCYTCLNHTREMNRLVGFLIGNKDSRDFPPAVIF